MSKDLRKNLIRLAHEKKALRPHLLPLLAGSRAKGLEKHAGELPSVIDPSSEGGREYKDFEEGVFNSLRRFSNVVDVWRGSKSTGERKFEVNLPRGTAIVQANILWHQGKARQLRTPTKPQEFRWPLRLEIYWESGEEDRDLVWVHDEDKPSVIAKNIMTALKGYR